MSHLSPQEPFALKQTNVSNPSVVHSKPSQQSITASEHYYSLSASSENSADTVLADDHVRSSNDIRRYETPPSRVRTPWQSRDRIQLSPRDNLATQHEARGEQDPEVRKTPMRGQGKRRSTSADGMEAVAGPSVASAAATPLREGGVRRKPVSSTIVDLPSTPDSQVFIDPSRARSSVARHIYAERHGSPPTPEEDDTQYIHFALDQLTRDEEVGGRRMYPGQGQYIPYRPSLPVQARDQTFDEPSYAVPGIGGHATERRPRPTQQWPAPQMIFDEPLPPPLEPPPRDPRRSQVNRESRDGQGDVPVPLRPQAGEQEPNVFIPTSSQGNQHPPLTFLPGILRPLQATLFIFLILLLLAALLFCAIWSLLRTGLWNYATFGDARYFVFEYLPPLLGTIVYFWIVQLQVAVYRIAPFIAVSSNLPHVREMGVRLPVYPQSFLLPYLGHFATGQTAVGVFMVVAWLQVWTIPLLGSSFNVYFDGSPTAGRWRWIATQGAIWAVIGLYVLFIAALIPLLVWHRRQETGLKWDPRSLADITVLLERSNALTLTEHEEIQHDIPRLGYWRTSRGGNEVFHSYGIPGRSARRYSLEDGRIREKAPFPSEARNRSSDDPSWDELSWEQRQIREKMQPKHIDSDDGESLDIGRALPWFLRPSAAILWITTAVVFLLAFLIVSYLPSTRVSNGFLPDIPAPVNQLGFSGTNFLYSLIPGIIGMICLLGFLDIDYAHRRLTPYVTLLSSDGELAERSLLLSYTADLPVFATASALANRHWKVALFSFVTLLAAGLPILGSGVFWAQFYIPTQQVRISAHMPGYYALSVLVSLYALAFLFVFPDRALRHLDAELPPGNRGERFQDLVQLVRQSRMLDDFAFHAPASKTDLVTRLLSAPPGAAAAANPATGVGLGVSVGRHEEAAASKVSLADSVRGFGRARAQVASTSAAGVGAGVVRCYIWGGSWGGFGWEWTGIDRLRG